tara:strand:- start:368 stop:1330 length:963 start_codon:yes stop_codon:yes gene_type:complete
MRNLGAWGALLVIFVGSFYMGKATSYRGANLSVKKEPLRKDKRKAESKRSHKKRKEYDRGPQSIKENSLKREKLKTISQFIKKEPYLKIAKIMKIKKGHEEKDPILNVIISLEESSSISHEDFVKSKDRLLEYLSKNPEESFKQMVDVVRSDVGRDNSSLRGQLMVAMSFVPGKEEEVKDLAIEELKTNIVPINPPLSVPGDSKEKFKMMGAMEQVAVIKAYEAFLSASHKNLENVQEETLEILSFQKNLTVRRNLAILYDKAFPNKRMEMLQKMKEKGINLMKKMAPRGIGAGVDEYYENDGSDRSRYYDFQEDEREDV